MRIRIDVAYDGAGFHGWAIQPGLRTVQGVLQSALVTVLRLPEASVTCAGRTDTGVHARGQVAHLDLADGALEAAAGRDAATPTVAVVRRLNGVLPDDVRVRRVVEAPAGFEARFSAVWRRYAYRVADGEAAADPLVRGHVLTWRRALDLDAMNQAAAPLLGEHDFSAFCRRREGGSTIRTLLDLRWERDQTGLAVATARADAFCHHHVRSMVGCLLAVGDGRQPPPWPAEVLRAGVRVADVNVAPARGLTLEEVAYPADDQLAVQAQAARRVRTLEAR